MSNPRSSARSWNGPSIRWSVISWGARYTPRAYVERLVIPTVVEPLREEWDAARTAAVTLAKQGDTAGAVKELERFHDRLCEVKVLDPDGRYLAV